MTFILLAYIYISTICIYIYIYINYIYINYTYIYIYNYIYQLHSFLLYIWIYNIIDEKLTIKSYDETLENLKTVISQMETFLDDQFLNLVDINFQR